MEIIKYDEMPIGSLFDIWKRAEKKFKPSLLEKYCGKKNIEHSDWFFSLQPQLPRILYLLKEKTEGKNVLDLGCGSKKSKDNLFSKTFEPWLCRALHELNSKPIGVDIATNEGELFENYALNLLEPNSLDFIPNNSVDIANARMLFNSPCLYNHLQKNPRTEVYKILIPQLERIVKPDGFFVWSI